MSIDLPPDLAELVDVQAERHTRNDLPVLAVDIIVDKQHAGISPEALAAVKAATGVADITFEELLGGTHTRVIVRPTRREAVSLITSAIYHDVVNGVKQ